MHTCKRTLSVRESDIFVDSAYRITHINRHTDTFTSVLPYFILTFNKTYIDCKLFGLHILILQFPRFVGIAESYHIIFTEFSFVLLLNLWCVSVWFRFNTPEFFLNNSMGEFVNQKLQSLVDSTYSPTYALTYSFIKIHGLASIILLINNRTFLLRMWTISS